MTIFKKLLIAAVVLCAPLMAQAEGKIAILDVQAAILNTDAAQARLKSLREQASYSDNRKDLDKLKKAFDDAVTQLKKDAAVMSKEQQLAQRKTITEKRADIEHVARKLQAAEQELGQALMQELGPKLQQAAGEIVKSEGIGLLLDRKAAIHADSSYSITAKVTDKLNQK